MRQAHHHSLSLTERGSDGTTIIPSSNKHITCDEVRRGDQCPEFFFVPNTWEDNTTNTFHSPLSENIKEHAQQQTVRRPFLPSERGPMPRSFFVSIFFHISPLLPGHKYTNMTKRGETQNPELISLQLFSTPTPTYFVFRTWHLFH